jgi:hypothetical protein
MNDFLLNHDKIKTYHSATGINEELPKVESKFYVLALDTTGPRETPKLDGLVSPLLTIE